jgi:hypothetical protein
MVNPSLRDKIFILTERMRYWSGIICLVTVCVVPATLLTLSYDGTVAAAIGFSLFTAVVILVMLGVLGMMKKAWLAAAAPFMKQIPDDEIQARVDRAFQILMGWYIASGRSPDKVVTFRPLIQIKGMDCVLKMRIQTARSDGNDPIQAAAADKQLQHALRDSIAKRRASLYRLSSLFHPPIELRDAHWFAGGFQRQGVVDQMSNHERLAALSAYRESCP